MHYLIELIKKNDLKSKALESYKRQSGVNGRSQAYALLRQLGAQHPDKSVLLIEYQGWNEVKLIAACGLDVEFVPEGAELIGIQKDTLFQRQVRDAIKLQCDKPMTLEKAIEEIEYQFSTAVDKMRHSTQPE